MLCECGEMLMPRWLERGENGEQAADGVVASDESDANDGIAYQNLFVSVPDASDSAGVAKAEDFLFFCSTWKSSEK